VTDQADTTTTPASGAPASPADVMASLAATAPPADLVRNSPEYLAQQEQIRTLARQAGDARRQAEMAQQQLAQQAQAAEAQRVAALQQQLQATLGADAALFGELGTLMQTDPVAAAQRFAELRRVQSAPTTAAAPSQQETPVTTPPVPTVPSMQGGLSASAPLGAPPQRSLEEEAQAHIASFETTVAANRDLQRRTQVRMKERAEAVGNYVRGALMRDHGVKLDVLGFQSDRER
jgi:hypothetical protein